MGGNDPPPDGGGIGTPTMAVRQPQQQQPGHVHDQQGCHGPPSYSEKLMANIRKSERYSRNVLEINLECENSQQNLDKKMIADTFAMLGIDIKFQLRVTKSHPRKYLLGARKVLVLTGFAGMNVSG